MLSKKQQEDAKKHPLVCAAEEIRTPTPLRAQRPQRCLSTSFNTAAWFFNRSANVTAILVFSKNIA